MTSFGAAGTGKAAGRPAPRLGCHALAPMLILAMLLLSTGCGDKNTYTPPPPPKVTVSQPVTQPVTDYLEFTGNTQAINTVQLKARVEGYLEKVFFKDGDRVQKGQLLFLIQQNTYEAKLKQAEAEILAQKAKLFHAQTEYARFTKLVTQKAAAQTDVDNWLYQRDAAQAAVMSSEAQRDLARLNLSYTKVTSPFVGRIGRRLKDPGNLVGAGEATLLADVDQIDPLYVYFTMNERDLLDVTKETKESVDAAIRKDIPLYLGLANEADYPHKGYLDFASISLNATTGTLTLRGVFPNPKGMMLPGLFAKLRVPMTHDKSALLVPTVAIGFDQLGPYVLTVDDKNVVQRRGVKLGAEVKDLTVITEGLKEQEWVITNGLLMAIPGKQVTPVKASVPNPEQPPAPAPGGQLQESRPMISEFFIDRPIFANVIAIVTVILGLVCLITLPVAQYPEIVPPTIQVTTMYPGASAEVIANTVGIPIEQAVNGVEGSIYMSSTSSSSGNYTLTVTFAVGTNLNAALTLVQNMVNGATAQLPQTVQAQSVTVRKVSTNILQVISIYSDDERYDATYLSNYAIINLQYPLGRLAGVGQIQVFGAGQYSMRVWLDPNKLKYYNLTTLDVVHAIQNQNVQVVAGRLGAPPTPPDQAFQFTVNALGRLSDVNQFSDIIVKSVRSEQGETAQLVRVKDIARVDLDQQFYSNFGGLSGKQSAQIMVFSLPGANAIDVGKKVSAAMAEMSQTFPEGLKYAIFYDTTKFISQAIHAVYETLFEAGILVLIVIMVFLQNWRAMLVPATTVPVTIIGAFAAMALLGFTVNLMTLFALILAIGIVVDDAIVVVENASVYIEKGLHPREAAIKAMKELTGPILGITLVLTAVFIPAAFMPGITGQLFRQFALVIASTAIISAINALTLKPAQCALWLRPHVQKKPNFFYRGFNKGYAVVEHAYVVLIQWMVARTTLMVLVFIAVIALAGWRFTQQPTGFLPTEDQGYAMVLARLPEGAAQPRVKHTSDQIDAILKRTPGVEAWISVGGFSILDATNVSNIMTTFVIYQDWSKRGSKLSQEHIVGALQQELFSIQDAQVVVLVPPPIAGLGQAGGFQMMVEDRGSLGLAELEKATMEVIRAASGQSGLGGMATTFSARSPQLYLDIDRTKAESLNIPLNNVFDTLQAYLGSTYVNLFNKFNQVFQVYVQADAAFRLQPEDIKSLYVRNLKGEMAPLGTLLKVNRILGSELVTRYNLYPAASIFGGAAPGFSSGEAIKLMEQVAQHTLPRGMSYDWTATSFQEQQVGSQAYFIYALSITLVFLVLAAQYENWFNPAAVILVVPIAMVGVLLGLMIRDFDNNIYTQVGLVLMIALASKNAILVVEFARELRADGMSITEAAVEATRRRFRPIVMTSFAFILGVVPLMVAGGAGAASQQAIGTVVFGGMLASTLLAIPFVPVFYVITQRLSERRQKPAPPAAPPNEKVEGS